MLKNNNRQIVRRLADRSMKSNRRRTMLLFLAIVLSSFMIFSVFTVGITYFKAHQIQTIRLNGADFDAIMYGITPEQMEKCKNNPDIAEVGTIAICGPVTETEKDDTVNSVFIYADDVYWNKMMKPAREWVKGSYPDQINEVMVTEEALEEGGLEGLGIGDSFTVVYEDGKGKSHTGKFMISGMWDGYGTKSALYVSQKFYEESGYEISSAAYGRAFMNFNKKFITGQEQDSFIDSMNLGKQQRVFFTGESSYSIPVYLGLAGLILIICFCAYLLIYNILYLSVSENVRFYGLLQTIGMTGGQIRKFIKWQMCMIGGEGILCGILIGSAVSFGIVPVIVKAIGIRKDFIEITFQFWVFFLAVLLTGVTIWAGSRKPIRQASEISPVEALGYRPIKGRKKLKKGKRGRLLLRMAREQITKDRKKSIIIMLSLAVVLSVFLCMVTLLKSQGARTMVNNYMDMDLVIQNDTVKKEDQNKWSQIFTPELLEKIKDNERIKEVHPMWSAQIMVPWEPEFADVWMKEFYAMWMTIPYEQDLKEYKEHPENFGSFLIGIDDTEFNELNETMEKPVDREKFLSGDTCILYRNSLDFTNDDFKGKRVTCAEYGNAENTRSFEIAGLTDESYYVGSLLGTPPIIIVSDQVVKDFVDDPLIDKVGIRYREEYDEKAEEEMLSLMDQGEYKKAYSYESKIEERAYIEKSQGNKIEIGVGITLILGLIGILNYINTVIGNVQNRQTELAILESVGMTEHQLDKMLMYEGMFLAFGSVLITGTAGLGITYLIFQSVNYMGASFTVPFIPVITEVMSVMIICTVIPVITRKSMSRKQSVIERIKGQD